MWTPCRRRLRATCSTSGDWVTARLDGVAYLEKGSADLLGDGDRLQNFRRPRLGGAHSGCARGDWACLADRGLRDVGFRTARGILRGPVHLDLLRLFLFTRILISDVMLTASIALSMWAFLRAIDEDEPHPRWWAFVMAASLGTSLLFKSLIGVVFPVAAALIYLGITRQFFSGKIWKAIHPLSGALVRFAIAAPWHILAAMRNPPVFDFTMHSAPGEYHGFLWFFFINEQLLRFLNLRYPRDYNTVPRVLVLAVPPGLAVSVERLFPSRAEAPLQAGGSRRQDSAAGSVLDRIRSGFLHVSRPRRNIIRCRAIRRWRCCSDRLWLPEAAWIHRGTRVLCGMLRDFRRRQLADLFPVARSSRRPAIFRLRSARIPALTRFRWAIWKT